MFQVTLDLNLVYNICKFQFQLLQKYARFKAKKNETKIDNYRSFKKSPKQPLLTIRGVIVKLTFYFLLFFISLPVTTGSDGRNA